MEEGMIIVWQQVNNKVGVGEVEEGVTLKVMGKLLSYQMLFSLVRMECESYYKNTQKKGL
jgi:hypothetical protein